jgi:hypothetical protein
MVCLLVVEVAVIEMGDANKPPPPPVVTPAAGEKVSEAYYQNVVRDALSPCSRAIEKSAKYDLRWSSSFLVMLRFSHYSTYRQRDGTLILSGDDAEAQNGFGNWVRIHYSCSFDPETKTVSNVTMDSGKLPE